MNNKLSWNKCVTLGVRNTTKQESCPVLFLLQSAIAMLVELKSPRQVLRPRPSTICTQVHLAVALIDN